MTDDTTPHEPHLAATEPSELTSVAAHVVPSIRHSSPPQWGLRPAGNLTPPCHS